MPAVTSSLLLRLRDLLGERLSTAEAVRDHHSHAESWHEPARPDAVVFPGSTDEVAVVVQVNGKVRDKLMAAPGTPEKTLETQALALENSPLAASMAEKIAARLMAAAPTSTDDDFTRAAFHTILAAEPSADELAAMIPGARAVTLPGKDHMTAVGDRGHKAAVLAFLDEVGA